MITPLEAIGLDALEIIISQPARHKNAIERVFQLVLKVRRNEIYVNLRKNGDSNAKKKWLRKFLNFFRLARCMVEKK